MGMMSAGSQIVEMQHGGEDLWHRRGGSAKAPVHLQIADVPMAPAFSAIPMAPRNRPGDLQATLTMGQRGGGGADALQQVLGPNHRKMHPSFDSSTPPCCAHQLIRPFLWGRGCRFKARCTTDQWASRFLDALPLSTRTPSRMVTCTQANRQKTDRQIDIQTHTHTKPMLGSATCVESLTKIPLPPRCPTPPPRTDCKSTPGLPRAGQLITLSVAAVALPPTTASRDADASGVPGLYVELFLRQLWGCRIIGGPAGSSEKEIAQSGRRRAGAGGEATPLPVRGACPPLN